MKECDIYEAMLLKRVKVSSRQETSDKTGEDEQTNERGDRRSGEDAPERKRHGGKKRDPRSQYQNLDASYRRLGSYQPSRP